MRRLKRRARRGFSYVELLAVVLILAVLAAVAVPLYINTRRTAAARSCKANIAAIAASESAFVLRNGRYATMVELTNGSFPEGLAGEPVCPLNRAAYTGPANQTTAITITCVTANITDHQGALGTTVNEWSRTMPDVPNEAPVP